MLKPCSFIGLITAAALMTSPPAVLAEWQKVTVDQAFLLELFGTHSGRVIPAEDNDGRPGFWDEIEKDGAMETIARIPGCSEGPAQLVDAEGQLLAEHPTPASGEFSFFVDVGDGSSPVTDLLIYFAGGGACWNAATCVGSALTIGSTYLKDVWETADYLEHMRDLPEGGILATLSGDDDAVGLSNPFAGFAKVYIPYCTGDVHIGSSDVAYRYRLPTELGGATLDWTIRHRGFDNLAVVLAWLQRQQESAEVPFERIAIAGSSAGGYGALMSFPSIRSALGEDPRYWLIVDGANGVVTSGFLRTAFGSSSAEGNWGVHRSLSPLVIDPLDSSQTGDGAVTTLVPKVIQRIGEEYHWDMRISQATSAYDAVQTTVYQTMKDVDRGTYTPFAAPSETELYFTALLDWSPKATLAMLRTALRAPNYRFYIGAGEGHLYLVDPPPMPIAFATTNYFEESSARGVYLTDWLEDMLNNPKRWLGTQWLSLSCHPWCMDSM